MTKRVIQLLRVSTAGQAAEDRVSLPSQRTINERTAKAYGLTIIDSIELFDMFPRLAVDDKPNGIRVDDVFVRNLSCVALDANAAPLANLSNDLFRDLCVAVRLTSRFSALRRFIVHVVLMCAEKKMRRVNAGRIVASVKNLQSVRYRAIVQLPRKTMCSLGAGPFTAAHPYGNCSVAQFPAYGSSPEPAAFRLSNFVPKASEQRRGSVGPITPSTAKLFGLAVFGVSSLAFPTREIITAVRAFERDVFCYTMVSGHGVTSETGCVVSRLVQAFTRLFEPLALYHEGGGLCIA